MTALREAIVARWFDTDEEHHEGVTDEQILARLESLVGEGWHHAGKELERAELLRKALREIGMPESVPEHFDPLDWWRHTACKRGEAARAALGVTAEELILGGP